MATSMVRKQIYIPRRQDILIKRLSQTRGVSEAEIIRQAIENEIDREFSGVSAESQTAWDELIRFIEQRNADAEQAEPYRWNRDEIYAERERRWIKPERL